MVRSVVLLASLVLLAQPAWAGSGPTTTLIVVNEDSPASLHIGTQYARMRGIHESHICRLRDMPNRRVITVEQFRERVWGPIAAYLKQHDLESTIDCIAYSTGFPFGINFEADFEEPRRGPVPRVASLNSMTYLARRVMEKDRNYIGDAVNKYYRSPSGTLYPSHGFRSSFEWTRHKKPNYAPDLSSEPLDRYWLSTVLGCSGLQGNTTDEILWYLKRGVESDGTTPKGTVYLMEHKDIRARTRMPMYGDAVEELKKRKRPVQVLVQGGNKEDGKIPQKRKDVLGLLTGIANFDWSKYDSLMLPGAIAEHLTSYGGQLDGSGQTKLTAFLRAGAAGSSGTVAEPTALWWKFPTPFLHAHYADGCSLAEAFYQSVSGPYQLLIVGDPLARPFARFNEVYFNIDRKNPSGGGPKGPVKGTWKFPPSSASNRLEVFIDGRFAAWGLPHGPFEIDTTQLDDGHHELQVVGIEGNLIRTRSLSETLKIRVDNAGRGVTLRAPRKAVRLDQSIELKGRCKTKPTTVQVLHGVTAMATVRPKGQSWKASIPAARLGRGEHRLVARAIYAKGPAARSAPGTLTVEAPQSPEGKKRKPRKAKKGKAKGGGTRQGLHAAVTDATGKTHDLAVTWLGRQGKNQFIKQLRSKVKGKLSRIVLTGELHIAKNGIYTLAVNATGDLKIDLHGKTILEQRDMVFDKLRFAEVSLLGGWHPITIEYGVRGTGDLHIELGGTQVTQVLHSKELRH